MNSFLRSALNFLVGLGLAAVVVFFTMNGVNLFILNPLLMIGASVVAGPVLLYKARKSGNSKLSMYGWGSLGFASGMIFVYFWVLLIAYSL